MTTVKENITKEKYEELSKLSRAEFLQLIESNISDAWRYGYGYYGSRLVKDEEDYYIEHTIGNSCD